MSNFLDQNNPKSKYQCKHKLIYIGYFEAIQKTCRTLCVRLEFLNLIIHVLLAPVVQKVDNAIHRINHYPVDSAIGFPNTYLWDSDLSVGQRYPTFEQLGLARFLNSTSTYQHYFNHANSCKKFKIERKLRSSLKTEFLI